MCVKYELIWTYFSAQTVSKIAIIGCFGAKPYLKTPNARKFWDQNDRWVEIIKGEKRDENLSWGLAMVTKIVKKHLKRYIRH